MNQLQNFNPPFDPAYTLLYGLRQRAQQDDPNGDWWQKAARVDKFDLIAMTSPEYVAGYILENVTDEMSYRDLSKVFFVEIYRCIVGMNGADDHG